MDPTNGCTYICIYICMYVWIRWMDVHMYAYICVYGSHEWMYIYMYICIYISIRWMDVHIYAYIYIYIFPSDEWKTGFCINRYRYRYTCIYVCVCLYMHVWMDHWTHSSIKSSIHRIHAYTTRTYTNAPHHGQRDLFLPAHVILFSVFHVFGERCNTEEMQHQRRRGGQA